MNVDNTAFKSETQTNISDQVLDNTIPPPIVGGQINGLADLVKFWLSNATEYVDKIYDGTTHINGDGDLELVDDLPPINSKLICAYVNDVPINVLYDYQNQVVKGFGDYIGQDPIVIKITFLSK